MRVSEYFRAWCARETDDVRRGWKKSRESLVRRHALPIIGHKQLDKLAPADLRAILDNGGGLAVSSRNKVVFSAAQAMLRDAALEGIIAPEHVRNLFGAVKPLPDPRAREMPSPLTPEELDGVLHAFRILHPDYYPLVLWQATVGTRPSEAMGLIWADIDWQHCRAFIVRGKVEGVTQGLKTARSRRTVPIPTKVITVLRPLRGREPERVFPFCLRTIRETAWRPVMRQLFLEHRFYDLRATAISTWLSNGMFASRAAALAGDKQSTIEGHYARYIAPDTEIDKYVG